MSEFAEFLAMGGYARYVWPAYAVALILMLANVILPHQCENRQLRQLRARRRRQAQAASTELSAASSAASSATSSATSSAETASDTDSAASVIESESESKECA